MSTTDPLGNTTTFHYGAFGNQTERINALGRVTTYSYDANGNQLTEVRTRTVGGGVETLTASYEYDAENRQTRVTFADGSSMQTSFNAIGKKA